MYDSLCYAVVTTATRLRCSITCDSHAIGSRDFRSSTVSRTEVPRRSIHSHVAVVTIVVILPLYRDETAHWLVVTGARS